MINELYEYAYINGIKRLQNSYRIYKFPLFEKYGIVQYNDSRYDKLIHDCVKKIEVLKQSNNCRYDYEVPNGNNGYTKCFKVSIKPYNSIIWLKELNIYYGICDYDYFDCFLLDSVDITENDVLIKSDNFIYHNNMSITPFIEKNSIVETASIVLLCSEHYKIDLFSAIRHELKHLYDSHINHIKIQNLSADIISSELYMKRNKLRFDTDYFMYSDNNLKYFSENITDEGIMTLLLDNMYLLNKSEMSSRLNQFYGFMKMHKIENAYLYSEVYNEYSRLKKIFEYIVKYAPQKSKTQFSEKYKHDFNEIVHKKFKSSNYFNDVFNYYITSINRFLHKCISIYIDMIK